MLLNENTKPELLGYDKPSNKFLSFLSKHYGLCDYLPQNNNFVVFNEYFENVNKPRAHKSKSNIDLVRTTKSPNITSRRLDDNYNNRQVNSEYTKKDFFTYDKQKKEEQTGYTKSFGYKLFNFREEINYRKQSPINENQNMYKKNNVNSQWATSSSSYGAFSFKK
jgi:hypothetical protein